MSAHLGPFLTSEAVAAALREQGIPCTDRTPSEWARRWPGISLKVGGKRVFPQGIVPLLLNGVPFRDIPARLANQSSSAPTDSGKHPAGRRSAERGERRRR